VQRYDPLEAPDPEEFGIEEMITEFLMGHRPVGVSRRYVVRAMLNSGAGDAISATQDQPQDRRVDGACRPRDWLGSPSTPSGRNAKPMCAS